jgi:molybdopterin-guanine dinucleotide biosynthesis protein A
MAPSPSETAGLILIGGQSARMGTPKALALLAGEPLWQHVARALTPLVDVLLFLGQIEGFLPPAPARVIRDNPSGIGPLGGMVAGLEQSGHRHHLLVAVDYPLVRPALLSAILANADLAKAVCGAVGGMVEALIGYYHVDCAPAIRQMLAEGETRTHQLLQRVDGLVLADDEIAKIDPAKWSHFNVNTPSDLREAERRLRAGYPA